MKIELGDRIYLSKDMDACVRGWLEVVAWRHGGCGCGWALMEVKTGAVMIYGCDIMKVFSREHFPDRFHANPGWVRLVEQFRFDEPGWTNLVEQLIAEGAL
jgi:hypothetical protein